MLCLLMLLAADVSAEWNNYVINYKKELFGKGSQTWEIEAYILRTDPLNKFRIVAL